MSRELVCGEYSFKLQANPYQHPAFEKNTHRLLALLTSLRSTCGGVIYLVGEDDKIVTLEKFHLFRQRLNRFVGKTLETFLLPINMVISLKIGRQRSWAAILLKKSYDTLKYPTMEKRGIWKPMTFQIDMFGQVHTKLSDAQSQHKREMGRSSDTPGLEKTSDSPGQRTRRSMLLAAHDQEYISRETEAETFCLCNEKRNTL